MCAKVFQKCEENFSIWICIEYVGLLYNLWKSRFNPQTCDPEDGGDDNLGRLERNTVLLSELGKKKTWLSSVNPVEY